jgi:peroxiredoxin
MAATPSTMLPLGTEAPLFSLPDPSGRIVSLADHAGARAYLVMFLSNHCPYVRHVQSEIARVARDYQPRGVAVVAVGSNDIERYPDDRPERMAEVARTEGFGFPYLHDESQEVAKAYHAACTPDFFLFDRDRRLVYRGQLDGSRPSNGVPADGRDLRAALNAVLAGTPVPSDQAPSLGCNIKWRPGNEPGYFLLGH